LTSRRKTSWQFAVVYKKRRGDVNAFPSPLMRRRSHRRNTLTVQVEQSVRCVCLRVRTITLQLNHVWP